MRLYTVYRPLLLYLLLCYGKKFAGGGPFKTAIGNLPQHHYDFDIFSSGSTRSRPKQSMMNIPQQPQQRLIPIQLDINERKSTHKYQYFTKNGKHHFLAYPTHYFHQIREGDHVIWELAIYKYPQMITARQLRNGHYDIKVHFEKVMGVIDDYPKLPKRGKTLGDELFKGYKHTSVQVISKNLKLMQETGTNLIELDINVMRRTNFFDYSFNIVNKTHIYTCTEGYLFKLVRDGKYVHWAPTNEEYANMITVTEEPNGERSIKVFLSDDAESDDELKDDELSQIFDVAFALSAVYTETFLSPLEDIADQDEIVDVIGLSDEIEGKIPMTIDIMKKVSNEQYEYSRSIDYATYTPKHNFIFKLIRASESRFSKGFIIWNGVKPEEYANRIIIDTIGTFQSTYNASIYLTNGDSRHFSKSGKVWVEVEPLAILDIGEERSGYAHDIKRNNRFHLITYIPRGRFLFRSVKITKKISCRKIELEIWETKEPEEYAKRVIVKGSLKSEQYIVIFHANDTFKLFYRPDTVQMWRDESANLKSMDTLKLFNIDLSLPKPTDKEPVEEVPLDPPTSSQLTEQKYPDQL